MAESNYSDYGVLAGNNVVANSGSSKILGSIGSFNPITGSGTITATDQTNTGSSIDNALINAQGDYSAFLSLSPNVTSAATDIGGMTFVPGIYQFTSSSVTLGTVSGNNTITLDGNGAFIFQFPNGDFSTDSTLASVSTILINGAVASQTYWVVSGNVTFGGTANTTNFDGLLYCQGNVAINTNNSSILGSVLAFNNTSIITLNNNKITATAVQQPRDVTTPDYINLQTTLDDDESITIISAGGIGINCSGTLFNRYGLGFLKTQTVETNLADADSTLIITQLLSDIFIIPTSANRTLTLDTADNIINGIPSIQINDSFKFHIINTGTANASVSVGSGGSVPTGMNLTIGPSSTGVFRLRITQLSPPSNNYTIYRLN